MKKVSHVVLLCVASLAGSQVVRETMQLGPGDRTATQAVQIARRFLGSFGVESTDSDFQVGAVGGKGWRCSVVPENGKTSHVVYVTASTGHVSLYNNVAREDAMRTRDTPASQDRIRDLQTAEREATKVLGRVLPAGHTLRKSPAVIKAKTGAKDSRVVSKRVDGLIQGFPVVDVNYGAWIVLDALDGAVISYSANWIEPTPQVEYVAPKLTKAQVLAQFAHPDFSYDAELGWATKPGASKARLCWRIVSTPKPGTGRVASGVDTYVDAATGQKHHD